jgi:DNA-binding MarR family transcriptional regulator
MHLTGREYHTELNSRFDAVVIAPGDGGAVGELAVTGAVSLAGGRVVAASPLDEATRRIADIGSRPLVLLDAREVSEDDLVCALSRLDGLVAGRDLPMVVAIGTKQIDIAAAGLILSRHQILCDPEPADWIGAIAAAQGDRQLALHDRVSEGEAARLAKLNAEVARIADVLARLSKHDEQPRSLVVAESSFDYVAQQSDDHAISAADIRQIVRARRLRDRYVGTGLFEDPAWDMMLDLYAAHLERAHVSVSSLCIAAAVAPTTALRWIARLTEAGLFERRPDPFDRRRAFMSLTERGLDAMRRYVAMARALGLPVV